MIKILKKIISLIRSIYFNFRILPIKYAVKLPFWISQKVIIHSNSGKIEFLKSPSFRMVRFGSIHSELFGVHTSHWINDGTIIIKGSDIRIGTGCCIRTYKNARIEIGNNVTIGGNSKIISQERIYLGDNLRTAWDIQIIDTNFHYSMNQVTKTVHQKQSSIIIEKNCWIANRVSIMKNTVLPEGTIVASNSIVNKSFLIPLGEFSILIGGSPAKILGYNIVRLRLTGESEYNLSQKFKTENVDTITISADTELEQDIIVENGIPDLQISKKN